ncbi:Protein FAR1-RELATED SEQUENCE 5 [Platanthera zijinensis]|uniref:Protein FAR1-RELATED SEQUENCE 5 n=1 Tax=Platanthera zijinensis TaxID=2320716 RepID=A0AAP0BQN0_9ASPA
MDNSQDEVSSQPGNCENYDSSRPVEEGSTQHHVGLAEPYIGQCFDGLDAVYRFYNAYARKLGFGVRKNSSTFSKVSGDRIWKNYVCDKAGVKLSRPSDSLEEFKRRRETRLGCLAKLDVKKCAPDSWIVTNFIKEHNHQLDTPRRTIKHRSHHISHKSVVAKILMEQLHGSGIGPSTIAKTLNATGMDNSISAQNVTDHVRHQRKNHVGFQGLHVYQYLQAQQAKDPNFYFSLELDNNDILRSIFWADSRARNDYIMFGDVIVFDVAYKTNNLLLPFAPFTGVNHHRQSILLGCALLSDETEETFTWLFQQWLKCMFEKAPSAIITDMDHAMYNSIQKVFPNTRHRFCSWHINKHLLENVYEMRNTEGEFIRDYKKFYNSRHVVLSETRWAELISKYQLQNNKWLAKMWDLRRHWIPAFFKDVFVAGMTSTGRSESINSFFDGFVNSNTCLVEFLKQYEKALESRRHAEEVEDYMTMNSKALLYGNTSLETHAAQSYTKTMFKLFQNEFKEILCCLHEKVSCVDNTKTYVVGLSSEDKCKWFEVNFVNTDPIYITCECSKFETHGIFCKHILHILFKKQVSQIPTHYLLKRWTINARNLMIYDSSKLDGINHNSVTLLMKWRLVSLCTTLIEKISGDEESFKSLYSYISQKMNEVNNTGTGKAIEVVGSQVGSTSMAYDHSAISIRDPIQAKNKGRPKIASRISSGIEESQLKCKKRTCGNCGDKGHYATTCPKKNNVSSFYLKFIYFSMQFD